MDVVFDWKNLKEVGQEGSYAAWCVASGTPRTQKFSLVHEEDWRDEYKGVLKVFCNKYGVSRRFNRYALIPSVSPKELEEWM